jgi:hypothetical protein
MWLQRWGGKRILLFLKKKKQKDFCQRCAAGAHRAGREGASAFKKSFFAVIA